jgi:hypothetical protein
MRFTTQPIEARAGRRIPRRVGRRERPRVGRFTGQRGMRGAVAAFPTMFTGGTG